MVDLVQGIALQTFWQQFTWNQMINMCAPRAPSSCAQAQPRNVMHTVSMCIVGLLCLCMCSVRTLSLSVGQSMHGHKHVLSRRLLSRRTSLRAVVSQQSLLRLPQNLAAAHATLVGQEAATAGRAAPAWQHAQRLQHHYVQKEDRKSVV